MRMNSFGSDELPEDVPQQQPVTTEQKRGGCGCLTLILVLIALSVIASIFMGISSLVPSSLSLIVLILGAVASLVFLIFVIRKR